MSQILEALRVEAASVAIDIGIEELMKVSKDIEDAGNIIIHKSLKLNLEIMPIDLLGMVARPDTLRLIRPVRQQICYTT